MGLFDKIKLAIGSIVRPETAAYESVIENAWTEYKKEDSYFYNADLNKTNSWTEVVKHWPDKQKIDFVCWLVPAIVANRNQDSWSWGDKTQEKNSIREAFVKHLFRSKLNMDPGDVSMLYHCFRSNAHLYHGVFSAWPVNQMVNQVEQQYKGGALPEELRNTLQLLKDDLGNDKNYYQEKERIKLVSKIDSLLFAGAPAGAVKPSRFLGDDRLQQFTQPLLEAMKGPEQQGWFQLLNQAQKATGSKPTQKYLDSSKTIIKEMGTDRFKATLHQWMHFLISLKDDVREQTYSAGNREYQHQSIEFITPVNADIMKGLVWTCAHFHDKATVKSVAALAERCFKKIPGQGPTALSLGNACLYALYKSKGLDGIGELSRLKLRIRQSSTQALIDKYLMNAATEQGVCVSEVEDMAVDDYGLEAGRRVYMFEDYTAELVVVDMGKTEIRWIKPGGTLQKSAPAFVQENHAAKLKKVKETAKQVEQTLVAQRDRIDRMFRTGRTISMGNFNQYYLEHGLMDFIAKKLIWNFGKAGSTKAAMLYGESWIDSANEAVDISDAETVSLWHPVQATVQQIQQWRELLVRHTLQQPLKQAFRELYLLTEAEINTRTYSNRMAAHVLRQHQFNSLAKTRGWRYALMGAFDNGIDSDKASLHIPEQQVQVEYWISEVNADDAMNDTGIWTYVSTDQVRFTSTVTNQVIPMADVPPLVFSECMRDVDLFVGVCSVGNDPIWRDNGGLPAYRDYWTSYSFGELSELAKNRKDVLATLLPRLKIRQVATIQDKFLVVKGKLRTYKIHIGSTNILMEPNDQYLCIVPDRSQKDHTQNLFIPFEGDSGLSVILSKAFLLADDDQITDRTITSQIKGK